MSIEDASAALSSQRFLYVSAHVHGTVSTPAVSPALAESTRAFCAWKNTCRETSCSARSFGLADDLARECDDIQSGVCTPTHGQDQQRGGQRDFSLQAKVHRWPSLQCEGIFAASYSFSLLCNVFRLIPSSSAARVLLLVEASVCRMSSRSAASTVVPSGNRSDARSVAEAAGAVPEIRGQIGAADQIAIGHNDRALEGYEASPTFPGHE